MMAGRNWSTQEYFDRQDEWDVVFYFAGENGEGLWHAVQVIINDWTWHIQDEGEGLIIFQRKLITLGLDRGDVEHFMDDSDKFRLVIGTEAGELSHRCY